MSRKTPKIDAGTLRLPVGVATAVGLGLVAPAAQADDFTVQNTADAGAGSLRDVIGSTNTNPGPDRILFKSGLSGEITLKSDLPPIEGPVEIAGPGPAQLAIDGSEEHQIFTTTGHLAVSGLTLQNARSVRNCTEPDETGSYSCHVDNGGAILAKGTAGIDVDDVVFRDNAAQSGSGGAISVRGDLSVEDSLFEGNSGSEQGGAIDSSTRVPEEPGDLTIKDSTFIDNETTSDIQGVGGGAVAKNSWFTVTSVVISGSTFSGNSTAGQGGALQVNNYGPVNVTDSTFTDNSGKQGGGAFISFWQGPGKISGSYFGGNEASHPWSQADGGGLVIDAALGGFSVENSTFFENETSGKGGAILSQDSPIVLDSITAVGNEGEGALFKESGQSTLRNSIVSGNTGLDLSGEPEFKPDYPWGGPAHPFWKQGGTWKTSNSLIGTTNETALVEGPSGSNIVGNSFPGVVSPADNGGPTPTMLPAVASPAVDQGSTDLGADQRGLSRPVGAADDIGAVELRPEDLQEPISGQRGKVRFGKVKLNRRKGVAVLPVKVPAAGAITLIGSKKLIGRKARTKAAGTVKLKVKSRGKALKALRKNGKVVVRVGVKFASNTGEKIPAGTSVKLVKSKPNKKKKR